MFQQNLVGGEIKGIETRLSPALSRLVKNPETVLGIHPQREHRVKSSFTIELLEAVVRVRSKAPEVLVPLGNLDIRLPLRVKGEEDPP